MTQTPEARVLAKLTSMGVDHEVIEIDPSDADTSVFCAKHGYPLERSCNSIIVASKRRPKRYAACVVLAHTRLDVNRRVKALMGVSRASFASAEEMQNLTGMEVGGVTPLTLPEQVPLYVDSRIMELDWIVIGGGGRSCKIKLSPYVFTDLGAEVVRDLAVPIS